MMGSGFCRVFKDNTVITVHPLPEQGTDNGTNRPQVIIKQHWYEFEERIIKLKYKSQYT